jgi:hypothetical protein
MLAVTDRWLVLFVAVMIDFTIGVYLAAMITLRSVAATR